MLLWGKRWEQLQLCNQANGALPGREAEGLPRLLSTRAKWLAGLWTQLTAALRPHQRSFPVQQTMASEKSHNWSGAEKCQWSAQLQTPTLENHLRRKDEKILGARGG
ncbi:rCG63621 [Rattus norvegicus]|uniref:RCG63621 n=1 Tax=Rattus norvegicus TaxID=10116 RepID=A6IRW0_RAT|nr:rCG63621 [Rattus norvegicus]